MKCILCHGTGEIIEPKKKLTDADMLLIKQKVAKDLRDKGYSYRQIMTALGYKSTRSISLLLK